MSRLIDADDIVYESIDSSDTNRHEYYYGTGIMAVRKEDIDAMPTIKPEQRDPGSIAIGELSDGFHTLYGLYEQRMVLFAALAKAYKNKAWKSYLDEDGEYYFGGGWFTVGIDTPEGSYTYRFENKYWDMFDCTDLPRAKHWDGHTEADAETRLMSLEPEQRWWISCSERLPDKPCRCLTTNEAWGAFEVDWNVWCEERGEQGWLYPDERPIAWMPLPEPYRGEKNENR